MFSLRSNVKWQTRPKTGAQRGEFVRVEIRGRLNSQVAAIGGETTGFTVTANGVSLELEFGRNAELRNRAKALHGREVLVNGRLTRKRGVEIRQRWIVIVEKLNAD